jgi:hypothetical protein
MGTGLGRTRVAREDRVFKLIEVGLLQDPIRIAQILEIPVPHLVDASLYDTRLARNENIKIAEGQDEDGKPGTPITPNSWDNHDIHIREHNNFRKTIEFQLLDPEIKQKFEYHVQQHEQLQMQMLQLNAQKAQLLAAATNPPPPPPPPPAGGDTAPPDQGQGDGS